MKQSDDMKTIEVVAAIITEGDKIFITQRGYGPQKDKWEFPGGKVEEGETREQALVREIKEELDTEITVERFITTVKCTYPDFNLVLHAYLCSARVGELTLLEHEAAKWVQLADIDTTDFLPADVLVVKKLKEG